MDAKSPVTTNSSQENTAKIVRACAEACGIDYRNVEKICPASEEQERRMDHHIKMGSYMMQMVLHYEGDLNQSFLLRILSAMRSKNHILRSRLIKHEGHVYQVVLRDSIAFHYAEVDLHGFLAQNSRTRMDYGTPLVRYAFIREPHGEAFFLWTGEPLPTVLIQKMEHVLTSPCLSQSIAVLLTRGGSNLLLSVICY